MVKQNKLFIFSSLLMSMLISVLIFAGFNDVANLENAETKEFTIESVDKVPGGGEIVLDLHQDNNIIYTDNEIFDISIIDTGGGLIPQYQKLTENNEIVFLENYKLRYNSKENNTEDYSRTFS